MVNWNNREEGIQALREAYPHMKTFLIDIVYDMYEESLTNEEFKKEIDRLEKEHPITGKPTMKDYDGYEYNTDCITIKKPDEFEDWYCRRCKRYESLFKSEEDPDLCKGCIKIIEDEKEKLEEI